MRKTVKKMIIHHKKNVVLLASRGWFERLKRRIGLCSIPLYWEATSADQEETICFVVDKFPKLIEDGGYIPEQVFNMNKTSFFWKRMPSRTFLYKDELKKPGFKANKDRVTLLMCGNAAGFILRPLNPWDLKKKALLPIYRRSNKMVYITKPVILDWCVKCYISQVKLYMAENGLLFKVLLLMECAGGHATDLHYNGVQVEFLPTNTTSLIEPMDQGIIRAFKALYTRSTMDGLISSISEGDEHFGLKRYGREYNIVKCLARTQKAPNEMKEPTLSASRKNMWPEVVLDYEGFTLDKLYHSAGDKSVRLAQLVANESFYDMTMTDVNTLIECHLEPVIDENLVEMTRSANEEEEEAADVGNDDEAEECVLTMDNLQEFCNMIWAM
ncbi:tigger transposable element-derived protein 1-like [Palaemon carinicauda]|uniref:tigger transposable element-derived protein 1-like n=1 Tax=Palaemon carinicauda TaxID=392227 RepID=UPI0035B61C4F